MLKYFFIITVLNVSLNAMENSWRSEIITKRTRFISDEVLYIKDEKATKIFSINEKSYQYGLLFCQTKTDKGQQINNVTLFDRTLNWYAKKGLFDENGKKIYALPGNKTFAQTLKWYES